MEKKRHLITTFEKRTFEKNTPVVFLGQWCLNNLENEIKYLDYKIAKSLHQNQFDFQFY